MFPLQHYDGDVDITLCSDIISIYRAFVVWTEFHYRTHSNLSGSIHRLVIAQFTNTLNVCSFVGIRVMKKQARQVHQNSLGLIIQFAGYNIFHGLYYLFVYISNNNFNKMLSYRRETALQGAL